jgi:hypothetical protein
MVYEQVYEPVAGNLELSALVAAIPILLPPSLHSYQRSP